MAGMLGLRLPHGTIRSLGSVMKEPLLDPTDLPKQSSETPDRRKASRLLGTRLSRGLHATARARSWVAYAFAAAVRIARVIRHADNSARQAGQKPIAAEDLPVHGSHNPPARRDQAAAPHGVGLA